MDSWNTSWEKRRSCVPGIYHPLSLLLLSRARPKEKRRRRDGQLPGNLSTLKKKRPNDRHAIPKLERDTEGESHAIVNKDVSPSAKITIGMDEELQIINYQLLLKRKKKFQLVIICILQAS